MQEIVKYGNKNNFSRNQLIFLNPAIRDLSEGEMGAGVAKCDQYEC